MEDGAPTLEAVFAVDTAGAFGNLVQLDGQIDSTVANAVAEFERVKKATAGMVDLRGSTTAVMSFGDVTTSAYRKAETAAERLLRQLERQSATFGKTREEIRALKVETAALAAEQVGAGELADKLRAQEAELFAQEYAAARQARQEAEASAEAKRIAAEQAAAAAEAEARAVRQAADAYRLFEAVAKQKMAAYREQQAVEAAATREMQAQIAAAERLRASIDPAVAAEQRFNREMSEARTLISGGAITLDEYCAKLRLERAALDEASAAQQRGATSAGAHRAAMAGLSFQVQDTFTQLSLGANPLQVLAIQGGQAAGQMAMLEGTAGSVARFMIGPWGLAITGGVLLLGMLWQKLGDTKDAAKDAEAAMRDFQSRQMDIGRFIDDTTGRLKEQNRTLISNAILLRQAKIDENKTAITKSSRAAFDAIDHAAVTGEEFVAERQPGRPTFDPAILKVIGAANGDVEKLDAGLQNLARRRPELAATVRTVSDAAARAVDLAQENRKLSGEIDQLNGKTTVQGKVTASLIEKQVALATATTPLAHARAELALVQERGAAAEKAGGAALEKYRTDLTAATKAVNQAEAAQRAVTSARRDANREANHAARLQTEAEATEAQITNLYKLADAYKVSDAAALIAEARVKAESQAIKERGDIEASVDRQVRLVIAQRVADADKSAAAMRNQSTAQEQVNAMVAAGIVPAERAAELVRDQIADLPLLAAIQAAGQRGLAAEAKEATEALKEQQAERERARAAAATSQFDLDMAGGAKHLAELREELRLVGATNEERVRALAILQATQYAKDKNFNPEQTAEYVKQQAEIAVQTERTAAATRNWADALSFTADKWDIIAGKIDSAANGLADAFGSSGRAIGDLASVYAKFNADRARAEQEHKKRINDAGNDQAAIEKENLKFALRSSGAQVQAFGDMAAAAKGFFKEGTAGYQALQKAEQVFRAVQFALSVRAIAQDAIETGQKLATSAARTAAGAVEAVVNAIKSLPFPLNLAAGAATIAALAAIGVSIAGSFGSGKKPEPSNTGTGTVLGDSKAQSESIKRALDALKEVDTLTNSYAREMAASLKSIDSQIGNVASLVVRAGNVDASAGVTQGFKANLIGSVLGAVPLIGGILKGLFGSKTTVTGNGLYGAPQSLGSILGGGFNAQYFSDIDKTHKFLGITTGHSYSTKYAAADPTLANQFTLILKSFSDAIAASAGPLGQATADIQNRLSSFVVNIGKIDLKDLTGEQIQEKLNAVFGAAADQMAAAAFPGIERFQKVGEGAFETLVRVASTVEQVTSSIQMLGGAVQGLSVDAKLGLADQFDSIGDLTSAADAYFQAFFSKEEQAAAKTQQLGNVFASLGLTMPGTLAAFRKLVEAQDLTTAAGQSTYATLLKLAPAFADLQSSLQGAKSAADIASERADLERTLLELQGNTEAIRQLDLAKLDASNRALQQQIWALQDAQDAAKAADDLRKAWTDIGTSIADEVKRIRGLSDPTGDTSFVGLTSQFNAATAAARAGDQDAAKQLPGLSQALLKAAQDAATSRQELERVQAQTAASLETTLAAINALSGASPAASTADALLSAMSASQAAAQPSSANDNLASEIAALREEVAQLRTENNAGHAANASANNKTAKVLENVTAASGGDAISVASAAA